MAKNSSSRVLISFDWALKRLLRQKANHIILEGFLTELLGFDVHIKNLLESESNKEAEDDKSNCVDLLCENQRGELFLIELQYLQEIDYFQRMLFGTSKLITEYLQAGEAYAQVRKVYSINILYFDLGQGKDYVYRGQTVFIGIHHSDELQLSTVQKERFQKDHPAGLYPEYYLLKINNFDVHAKSSLDEWIFYLKTNKLPNNFSARGLKEVQKKLKYDQMEPAEKKRYNKFMENSLLTRSQYETALLLGREEGIKKGKEEGREEGKRQMVINCFVEGLPIELISKIAGLSVEEVEEILKEA
jgi:predicted transposase/invertase (TIGR01784 family)